MPRKKKRLTDRPDEEVIKKLFPKKDGMIVKLPSPFNGWTQSRDMPPISSKSFKERWADLKRGGQS